MTVREILEALTLFLFQTGTFVFIGLRSPLTHHNKAIFLSRRAARTRIFIGRQAITGERREFERRFSGGSRIYGGNLTGEEFGRYSNVPLDMVCARQPVARHGGVALGEVPNPLREINKMSSKERSHFLDFEIEGQWWLPETPDRRVYGTLQYSQANGITIDVMDRLREPDLTPGVKTSDSLLNKFEIVLGQSDTLEPCTVLDSFETSGSLSPFGAGRSRLRAHRLYIGAHFTTEDEIQFSRQRLEFAYMEEWVSMSPFRIEQHFEPRRKTVVEFQHEPKEIGRVRIHNKNTDLWMRLHPIFSYGFQGEFTGTRRVSVYLQPDEERAAKWYENVIRSIGNLFTLCIGEPVLPRRIIGERSSPQSKDERIEIYIPFLEIKQKLDVFGPTMPVPFSMIQDRLASIINSWFLAEERIEPVLGLLLGTYYNRHMYVETEFLTLVQALEIFYRRLIGDSYMNREQWLSLPFKTLVAAIPPELEQGHKASLKKRLEYGYEYSLRK